MPSLTIQTKVPIDTQERLLLWLIKNIQIFENRLFSKGYFVQGTNIANWEIDIEDGDDISKVPSMFGVNNNKIRMGKDFIKRMYKFICYIVDFYSSNISRKPISNLKHIHNVILSNINNYYKNDDIAWSSIQSKQLQINHNLKNFTHVDFCFFYSMHFFINHEISHVLYPGSSWEIEEKCDISALNEQIRLMKLSCTPTTMDCFEWTFVGGIMAQILIASKTKQVLQNKDERMSFSHPFTFDRILNYIECFDKHKNTIIQNNNNAILVMDNFYAYLMVAIIFLYNVDDGSAFDLNLTSFEELCTTMLLYLHNEREIKEAQKGARFCPDEMIGYIKNESGKWVFTRRNDFTKQFVFATESKYYYKSDAKMSGALVIILESPHKQEFLGKGLKVFRHKAKEIFARPANGCTKRNFNTFINEVLKNISLPLDANKHPVIILNACCYQCSLGKQTKIYRDRLFKRLFESTISKLNKRTLIKRIKYIAPWQIINACTKGNNPQYILREQIDNLLTNENIMFYKSYHPSSWRKPCNRQRRA